MMWQMWTAFGLMLGYIFGVAFWRIGSGGCVVVDGRLTSDPKNLRLPCVGYTALLKGHLIGYTDEQSIRA